MLHAGNADLWTNQMRLGGEAQYTCGSCLSLEWLSEEQVVLREWFSQEKERGDSPPTLWWPSG